MEDAKVLFLQAGHEVADMEVCDIVHVIGAQACPVNVQVHLICFMDVNAFDVVHVCAPFHPAFSPYRAMSRSSNFIHTLYHSEYVFANICSIACIFPYSHRRCETLTVEC